MAETLTASAAFYPFRLNLYLTPPLTGSITIEDFETLAINRISSMYFARYHLIFALLVLKSLEVFSIRNLKDDEVAVKYRALEEKHMPLHSNLAATSTFVDVCTERFNDHVSHFILLLSCARTPDLQRWLINFECQLFKLRWNGESYKEKNDFFSSLNLGLETVSVAEKTLYAEKLTRCLKFGTNFDDEQFYKVPFDKVSDLVSRRAVFLADGLAFVPKSEIFSIVLSVFKESLERKLETTQKMLPRMSVEHDRIMPLLLNLNSFDVAGVTENGSGMLSDKKLHAAEIDNSAFFHFPPCMQKIHTKLKADAHLKHGARMQFGLFLKSIGLDLEEALVFWKKSFASKCGEEAFQKNYAYNIRHNYGKEGKRADYTAYSCMKIITSNQPTAADCHGCPFKHSSRDGLRSYLSKYTCRSSGSAPALNAAQVEEIVELASKQHYQVACSRLLECSRKLSASSEPVLYPSKFYELSLRAYTPEK